MLSHAEPQNFRLLDMASRAKAGEFLKPIRKKGEIALLARFYKFYFAVGKSTAFYPLNDFFGSRDDRSWRISVLGKAAVAAMVADNGARMLNFTTEIDWLMDLGRTEPEVLEQAQEYNGDDIGQKMPTLLAAILLCFEKQDRTRIEKQRDVLLVGIRRLLKFALIRIPEENVGRIAAYIDQGDLSDELPNLTSPYYVTSPTELNTIRWCDDNVVGFLGTCAFLAQRHDPRIRCAFRSLIALNPKAVLLWTSRIAPRDLFRSQFDSLVEDLPGGKVMMLLFLSLEYSWMDRDWRRLLASRCLEGLGEAMELADPNQHQSLSSLLPDAVKYLGRDIRETVSRFLENLLADHEDELHEFLMGSGSLADSAAQLRNVVSDRYVGNIVNTIREYQLGAGWNDFVCRCVVTIGLCFRGSMLRDVLTDDGHMISRARADALAAALLERELPVKELLDTFGRMAEWIYAEDQKAQVFASAEQAVEKRTLIGQLCDAAKNGTVYTRSTVITVLSRMTDSEEAREGILACTGDSSKQIQELLLTILPKHPEWAREYFALLKSKKASERILAARVLGRLGDGMRPLLMEALESEKSAKVADVIQSLLGTAMVPADSSDDLAERVLKNNKLKKIQWLLAQPLPVLHLADEAHTPVEEKRTAAILVAYCELGRISRSDIAAQLADGIDGKDLELLANEVYERWYAFGAQAKHKWVLSFAAVYGGSPIVEKLRRAINDWPQNARGAIACDAVTALVLNPEPTALVAVDAISRKFKFRQVKQAAAAALENAAQELGISPEELADRIVPDLGFDGQGKRVFDYGKRSFTVRLTPTLELEIISDAGKPVKNLPAPGKSDDQETAREAYEAFKAMKKQIKTTVAAQKTRLEAALSALRCWDTQAWSALFVDNPIMHQFAISLIWGIYENGVLKSTFRYMDDGSFNTVDEEEMELPAGASIGLVHPVELDDALLEGWKQQLEDYEITQSIQQLDRPVYRLAPEQRDAKALDQFGGKILNGLSLTGKLTGQGWFRGSVVDGGGFYTFWREDASMGMGVELSFSGSFVGYVDEENGNVTVYDAVFYEAGTVTRGSYCYDRPKQEKIFPLGQIPARYYSEIVLQLTRATASSTEHDPDWRKDRQDQ